MDIKLINGMVAEYALESLEQDVKAARGGSSSDAMKEYIDFVRSSPRRRASASSLSVAIADVYNELILDGKHDKVPFSKELAGVGISKLRLSGFIGEDEELEPEEIKEVVAAFAETEKHLHKMHAEQLQGITETESDFQTRLVAKWNKDKLVKKDVSIPLNDLLLEYGDQWKPKDITNPARFKKKKAELNRIRTQFNNCFGKILGVKEIDEDTAITWRNYLTDELEQSDKYIRNSVETMAAVFNYAMGRKRGYVEFNPFSKGIKPPKGKGNEQSRCFTAEELQKYIDVLTEYHNPETLELTWLPLIMLFSGMRPNEVAQLYVDDIRTDSKDNIYFFRITSNEERRQRVKTQEAREVPIHATLIELGFLNYVESMRAAGKEQVFPNCVYKDYVGGHYSHNMSTFLNRPINLNINADTKLRL